MSVRLPDTPVSVRIDRQAVSLILSNLISNAVKYTPSGSVRVRLMQEDAWAAIEVEDAGMGIPADEIPALFAEFFRASNARGSEINGTGVGLAGVNERVDRFGGQIELTSEVDEGSTFLVRLSLYDPAPALV